MARRRLLRAEPGVAVPISQAERFLVDFHNANAGLTARAFGTLPVVRNGRRFASSYESLAETVPAAAGRINVLDLACGDGFLLSLLAGRHQTVLSLIGVDISEAEIGAARARLGPGAALHLARAQALPLPSDSVDVALCHMALMLMDDVEGVIAELRRVLKKGARLCAVVGAVPPPSAAFDAYVALLGEFPRRTEFATIRFGDRRVRTPDGIEELLRHSFSDVSIEELSLEHRRTPAQLWTWFCDMYDLHLVSLRDRDEMQRRYVAAAEPLCQPDGKIEYHERLRQVVATAV